MSSNDYLVRKLTFKTCISAIFADKTVSIDESHFLSHLIEQLGESHEEREEFRTMRNHEISLNSLYEDIAKLNKIQKEQLFQTVVSVIHSDRQVNSIEKVFIRELRKHCGISIKKAASIKASIETTFKPTLPNWIIASITIAILTIIPVITSSITDIASIFKTSEPTTVTNPQSSGVNCSGLPISFTFLDADSAIIYNKSSDIYSAVSSNIFRINVKKNEKLYSQGSGTVIGSDSTGTFYIVTNRHVIRELITNGSDFSISVKQYNGAQFDATLDFASKKHDLAFLRIPGIDNYTTVVPLSLQKNLKVGQKVYALGSPLGLESTFTEGIISAFREKNIQTDAAIDHGSSGGPLIEEHGALCGVVTSMLRNTDFGFAQTADLILAAHNERMEQQSQK